MTISIAEPVMPQHLNETQLRQLVDGSSTLNSEIEHLSKCRVCQRKLEAFAAGRDVWEMAACFGQEEPPTTQPESKPTCVDELELIQAKTETAKCKDISASGSPFSRVPNMWIALSMIGVALLCVATVPNNSKFSNGTTRESSAESAAKATLSKALGAERSAIQQTKRQQQRRNAGVPAEAPPRPPSADTAPIAP